MMRRHGIAIIAALVLLLPGCGPRSSLLEYGAVSSSKLNCEMEFSVLRAPAKADVNPKELPIFVLLHGMGDNHRSLDRYGLSDRLHAAMVSGAIPAVHFVMPYGERGFYFNWYDGTKPYEDYIIEEVIPAAETYLGVNPKREKRHIIGVSMGATGSINIGLRHPEMFASITALSGLIMDENQALKMKESLLIRWLVDVDRIWGEEHDQEWSDSYNPYVLVKRRKPKYPQKIYLAYGTRESHRFDETTGQFHRFLKEQSIEHKFAIYKGGHGWKYWAPVIEDAVRYVLEDEPRANVSRP